MASVIGLAPIRPDLKGRLRELLCIHGRKWGTGVTRGWSDDFQCYSTPILHHSIPKLVPEVGIAPTSPRLQRGANLPQLLGEMVVPAGNAPASPGYQPGALLLSYETMAEGVGNAPTSARADPVFKTGAASFYLPAFRS